MIKLLSTFLSASILFVLSYFFGTEAGPRVTLQAPGQIRPGESVEVKLTVEKGPVEGFARLQVFLPEGLTADGGTLHQAHFLHEDNFIKFIWIDLPPDSTFTVSMILHVAPDAIGTKYLNGFFSYLEEEASRKVTFEETAVEITPAAAATEMPKPDVERRILATAPEQGEYRVELDIRTHSSQQPARFIDALPTGFTAEALDAQGAVFSQEADRVIFRWAELPDDSVITVRYRVTGPAGAGAPVISGMLVYGIEAIDLNDVAEANDSDAADHIVDELIASENARSTPDEASTAATNATTPLAVPAPQAGLYFTVQVAATNRSPKRDNAWFSDRYHFNQTVNRTEHEGWNKYLIGQFTSYQEARSLRDKTRSEVNDAFVVAYDEQGNRIPVGQALGRKPLNQ